MTPLARRILTAAVLIPVVVGVVLLLPTTAFAATFAAFAVLAGLEWPVIADLRGRWRSAFWLGGVSLLALLAWTWRSEALWGLVLLLALAFWISALVWVIQAQHGTTPSGIQYPFVRMTAGWLILLPCWVACVGLHALAPPLVLLVLVLIWVADSAAFFAGRRFGRRRLAARVSPGKSWEGVVAGLLAVALGVAAAHHAALITVNQPLALAGLCVLVAALSVLGDLCESLFKRRAGVKDSGTLIPGHGGVLDRIDSLTAAAPVFTAGWLVLGLKLS